MERMATESCLGLTQKLLRSVPARASLYNSLKPNPKYQSAAPHPATPSNPNGNACASRFKDTICARTKDFGRGTNRPLGRAQEREQVEHKEPGHARAVDRPRVLKQVVPDQ
jgi:hypothetical protein